MIASMRMSRLASSLAVIGGLMIVTPAVSSDFRDNETYRCNAASGQFDGTVFPFSSAGTTISGKISLHSADTGTEWDSLGKILSHQRGSHYSDGDCGCNGIVVYADEKQNRVVFAMTANGAETPMVQSPFDTPISFKISISQQGEMTVAVGKTDPMIKTVKLRHPEHDTLEMSCSGADLSFFDIAAL